MKGIHGGSKKNGNHILENWSIRYGNESLIIYLIIKGGKWCKIPALWLVSQDSWSTGSCHFNGFWPKHSKIVLSFFFRDYISLFNTVNTMFGSSGPTAQEQAMMEVMEVKSVEDSLNMYNGLVENCFKTCVFNFKIRSLDSRVCLSLPPSSLTFLGVSLRAALCSEVSEALCSC